MASAHDVAAYILEKSGSISTWKLQKLAYYSQAWHLVWTEERLFGERIEAWANGPVVVDLYGKHRGSFSVSKWRHGDSGKLSKRERASVDAVLGGYGQLTGRQLSQLTHAEGPWNEARAGLPPTASSSAEITAESMHSFYSALDADENAQPVEAIDWDALEQ